MVHFSDDNALSALDDDYLNLEQLDTHFQLRDKLDGLYDKPFVYTDYSGETPKKVAAKLHGPTVRSFYITLTLPCFIFSFNQLMLFSLCFVRSMIPNVGGHAVVGG